MSAAATTNAAATLPPLQGRTLAIGSIALSLATFMNVLDTSIANVSIPAISGDLGVSPDQGTWVITSFAAANAICMPLTGWLTQRVGQVRLFVLSVFAFVIASFLCAAAPSMELLILFRIIQGAVAGPMIPLSQTLMLSSYPKEKSGTALAIWSMTTLVAPVLGPLLGGWITDNMTWPWIFYINIPIGLVAGAVAWKIYRPRESALRQAPIDKIGLLLLVVWVSALQIMLDKGKDLDWFASSFIVGAAITAVLGLAAFIVWELTEQHPVVDLRLFAQRNFLTGTTAVSLGYGTFFGGLVLLPLWLQQYLGYTATEAGMAMAPVGLLSVALSPVVGKYITRFDPRWFASSSFLILAVVFAMRGRFDAQVDFTTLMTPTIIQGAAMASFFVPLISISLSGLQPERIASATGLSNFVRILGGAIGTSVVTTLWDNRATLHHAQLIEHVSSYDANTLQSLSGLQTGGMSAAQALAATNQLINQQDFTLAATDIFIASAVLMLLMIPVVWLARPAKGNVGPISAH